MLCISVAGAFPFLKAELNLMQITDSGLCGQHGVAGLGAISCRVCCRLVLSLHPWDNRLGLSHRGRSETCTALAWELLVPEHFRAEACFPRRQGHPQPGHHAGGAPEHHPEWDPDPAGAGDPDAWPRRAGVKRSPAAVQSTDPGAGSARPHSGPEVGCRDH